MCLSPEHISCVERKLRRQKTQQSAKLSIIWLTWKSGALTAPWRQSKAITTAMWDAKICNQTTGIPLLHIIESLGAAMHLSSDFLHSPPAAFGKQPHPQAVFPHRGRQPGQPGDWSLSGEQTSAKLTLYICPIGYIYARLSHITPEVCFTGVSKQKEQNQKPNQPKNSKASYFSIFTQQI